VNGGPVDRADRHGLCDAIRFAFYIIGGAYIDRVWANTHPEWQGG
jgi:hypothetical protein